MYAAFSIAATVAMRRENESITSRKEGGEQRTERVWEKEAERDARARTYLRGNTGVGILYQFACLLAVGLQKGNFLFNSVGDAALCMITQEMVPMHLDCQIFKCVTLQFACRLFSSMASLSLLWLSHSRFRASLVCEKAEKQP